jgi:HEPN domain-containing protein
MALEANIRLQDTVAPVDGGPVNPVPEIMDEVARYWIEEADEALTILQHLFEKGDYSYALFFGHLAVEKLIKAAYVLKNKEHAPPIHNLPRLARMAGVLLSPERKEQLVRITSFNIEARYPDLKRSFRNKCTREFAIDQINSIQDVMKWLRETIPLKK